MAHHEVDELVAALQTSADLKAFADAVHDRMPPPKSGVLDAGRNKWLVVLPGYQPLSKPEDFFLLMDEVHL